MDDALFITYPRDDQQLNCMLETSPIAVMLVDRCGCLAALNKRAEQMFGYSRYELVGAPVDRLVPERLRGGQFGLLGAFMSMPIVQPLGSGRELVGLRKNRTEVPIEVGIEPFESPAGRFALLTVIDITERKRAETLRLLTPGRQRLEERVEVY